MSPRRAVSSSPNLPPVEVEPPSRDSDGQGVRVRFGRWELAARGASAVYAVALAACVAGIVYVLPPAISAVRDATQALHESAQTIRAVAEDVREARAGVGRLDVTVARVEGKLADIERDVGALRVEVRTCGAGKR